MSLGHPTVPRLELDRPSLADRIRAFKTSLSSTESVDPHLGTFRRSNEQYNSIDDIVSLLRTRAVESVAPIAAEPVEEISSIIEELRSKNSEVSISSPPREIHTAVRIPDKPTEINISDLVRRLTVDDEEDETPEKILDRIKNRLGSQIDTTKTNTKISPTLVSGNRVVIDSRHREMLGVGTGPDILRKHEMVKFDPLVLVQNKPVENSCENTNYHSNMIPDLVLLPHQLPYIEAETTRIRREIFRKIKL